MSDHPSLPHDNVPANLPSSPSSKNTTTYITKAERDDIFASFDGPPKRDDTASPSLVPAPSPSASLQRGNPLPRRVRQVWPKRKRGGRVRGEPRRARRAHPQRVPENEYAKTGRGYHARGRGGDAAFMYAVAVGAYTKYGRGGNTGTSVQGPTACTIAAGTRRTRTPRWAGGTTVPRAERENVHESIAAVRRHEEREWEQRPGMRRHEDRGRRMTV